MKNLKIKDILVPTLSLLLICVIVGAALGLANMITAEKISNLETEKAEKAMATVLAADKYVSVEKQDSMELFSAEKNGEVIGYVASNTKTGYGGDIKVMIGIDKEIKVTKIDIVSCNDETPGLGQNVKTDEFKSRFEGKSGVLQFGKNIDAWTGATISSTAVKDAVNQALDACRKLNAYEKGGN